MKHRFLRFPGGKMKAVTFSYDDAIKEDIQLAALFDKYNLKATFNLNSHGIGGAHLTPEEIQTCLLERGHEIAVHGASHLAPGKLRPIEGIREVLECRTELENMFGIIVRGMAYPNSGITVFENGMTYETVKNYLQQLDIAYARTLAGDNNRFELPNDWHAWMPNAHHDNEKIFEYMEEFVGIVNDESVYYAARQPRMFYIWGHSYEFERNGNWDRMEEICKRLAGREDSWYATNMEIYDYVTAYRSLVFSADGKRVYNPTDKEIWFEIIEDGMYCIKTGETICVR